MTAVDRGEMSLVEMPLAELLRDAARRGNERIRLLFPERFPDGEWPGDAAALCVVEEAGEFAGAYRRWRGYARRPGSFHEMAEELADVVIAAFFAADDYGVDLESEIRVKVAGIFSRSWKEPRS